MSFPDDDRETKLWTMRKLVTRPAHRHDSPVLFFFPCSGDSLSLKDAQGGGGSDWFWGVREGPGLAAGWWRGSVVQAGRGEVGGGGCRGLEE